ncbi:MAG TPA: ankyrin repeat domain-containing protein [Streptosporangiaceae bacterium]
MPGIPLPAQPSLENLKKQARILQQLVRAGLPGALDTVAEFHPRLRSLPAADPWQAAFSRADAQLVIARQYGFPSWPRLRRHLAVLAEYSRSPHVQPTGGPVDAAAVGMAGLADDFLRLACLVYDGYDPARIEQAGQILAGHPEVAPASIYTSAAAGDHEQVSALLRADPGLGRRQGGPFGWDPLLYAAYSRVVSPQPGRSTLEAARHLLAAGADPNAGYLWAGLPSPFTALAGALGRGEGSSPAHPQAAELATLLLESGADANDSQALYNCGLQSPPDDDGYLRLLLRYGLGRGDGGPWHRRLAPAHPSPRQLLDEELIKAVAKDLPERIALLLAHGADPAGRGAQHPVHGGHDSWQLATMGGHRQLLDLLATAGPVPAPEPDPALAFLGACMAGDARQVRALRRADPGIAAEAVAREPDALVGAAEQDRPAAVRLLAAAGFDVNALRRAGPRNAALHEAAWNGSLAMVELLVELGGDPALKDLSYQATPAGWAETNGQHEVVAYLKRRGNPSRS